MPSATHRTLLLVLLLAASIGAVEAGFAISFDGPERGASIDPAGVRKTAGRLGMGGTTTDSAPLRFALATPDLPINGSLSLWVASTGALGYGPASFNILDLQGQGRRIRITKGEGPWLWLVDETKDGTRAFRYPFYDFAPGKALGLGERDSYRFIVYQWEAGTAQAWINGIAMEAANAPASAAAAAMGTLALGGGALAFDEVVCSPALRSKREIVDLYTSYRSGRYLPPRPEFTVTEHTGRPIAIDGVFDPEEWKNAACYGGLHNLETRSLLPYDARFYVTYDQERVYLAMRSFAEYPLTASLPKAANGGDDDTGVCMEDCLEVLLMPYESIRYDYFHFLGNSRNRWADQLGTDVSWRGAWNYANAVADGVWTAELSIPYASLATTDNRARYPKLTDTWRFNFCRNWNGVLPHWANICYQSSYGDYNLFGQMRFERQGLSVRWLGTKQDGDQAMVRFELVNLSTQPRSVTAFGAAVAAVLPFSEEKRPLVVPANSRQEVAIAIPLRGNAECTIEYGFTDATTGGFLWRGSGRLPVLPGEAEGYRRQVADEATHRRELETRKELTTTAAAAQGTDEKEPTLWPDRDAVEQALARRRQWKNNRIGEFTNVPPPWTPVRSDGTRLAVWERSYDYTDALILRGLRIKGEEVMAGPVALVVENAGKRTRYERGAAILATQDDLCAEVVAAGGDERFGLSTRTRLEFDGCAWTELSILAKGEQAFERMWLEVPMKSEHAACYSHWYDKESGSNAGRIPKAGIRETWKPYVWMGDVSRGLSWWTQETRDWFVQEPERSEVTCIEPEAGGVTRLRIMLTDKPARLDGAMRISFGLMGTPVKPMPRDWRLWDFFCGWSKLPGMFTEWGSGYFVKEPRDPAATQQRLEQHARQGPYEIGTPNCGSYFFSETNYADGRLVPDVWLWLDEFLSEDRRTAIPKRQVWRAPKDPKHYAVGYTSVVPTPEYTDLFMYNYRKLLADYPLLKGIYMDSCIPMGDNPLNGTGYVDRWGRRRQTVEIMNSRTFMKRLYGLFVEMRGNPDEKPWVIYNHCSNQLCPPIHGFATGMLQGEGLSVGARAFGDHPVQALGVDGARVAFNGHTYGWIEHFLGYYNENPETIGELNSLFLMHDHNVMGRGNHEPNERFSRVVQRGGLHAADDRITFIPYWDPRAAVRTSTPGGYANAYLRQGAAPVITVFSMDRGTPPIEIELTFDRNRLGVPAGPLALTDLVTGEIISVPADRVVLPIRRFDFRGFSLGAAK